ncbi:putative leader peptide [Frankia canadensis]
MFRTQLVQRRAVDLCRVSSCLCRFFLTAGPRRPS